MKSYLRYIPDLLILVGIYLVASRLFVSCSTVVHGGGGIGTVCEGRGLVLGIVLIAVGLDIALRKRFAKQNAS